MPTEKPVVDKFIGRYFPGWAYSRARARHNIRVLNSVSTAYTTNSGGYRGGHYGRLRGAPGRSTAGEDNAASWTYRNMIANAMQLYRDDPMCKSVVDVCNTYMGESRPTATTSDPEWNAQATAHFNTYWWPQADARQRPGVDYGEMQSLFDRWAWLGGDMLFALHGTRLLPYEGLQIDTPTQLGKDEHVTNGVRTLKSAPWPITHYYIIEQGGAGSITSKQTFKRVRANEVIWAGARNWRFSMLRSVPDLHGVIDAMHGFGKITDYVMARMQLESMIFTVEKKGAIGNLPGNKLLAQDSTKGTQTEHRKADWGMALKVAGDVDKDFKFAQMTNPQGNYVQVMEFMARIIAAGTGFPYEIVMHCYTNGSYTANRAARLDFAKALLSRWAWRGKILNQRAWNWATAKGIKSGMLPPAPVDGQTGVSEWWKCAWTLPHFPHIDEGKEVLADIRQWGCGQESMADWAAQRGVTRGQLLDAHDLDIEECKRRADGLDIPLDMYLGELFSAATATNEQKGRGNGTST